MATFVLPFAKISKQSVLQAGGKGANLGEMISAGIPVPPGFVVLSQAFDTFLAETDINVEIAAELDRLNHDDLSSVDRFSHEIRDMINDAAFPEDIKKEILPAFKKLNSEFVAVRSSATAEDSSVASWAGELETYLYVNKANLLKTVKTCWGSLFTPRAVFYRFEKKMHKKRVSVGVVVQKMVNSEKSGVCFTAHPVTRDRNQMVIEAGFGLGEAIVSGMITPDTYVLDKKSKQVIDANVAIQKKKIIRKKGGGTKTVPVPKKDQAAQILTKSQITKLAGICQEIEKHYRHPQDIEWALEKGRFYIVQTRPITTL